MKIKNESNSKTTSIFLDLLAVAFIVLKLCGVIDWPWVWVLAPIWIGFAVLAIVVIGVVIWSKWVSR